MLLTALLWAAIWEAKPSENVFDPDACSDFIT